MNKFKLLVTSLASICILQSAICNASAQSPDLPPNTVATNALNRTAGTFMDSVTGYFTTMSDLPTFQADKFNISLGTDFQSGQAGATLIAERYVYKSVGVISLTSGANVGGTITRQGLGVSVSATIKDVKFTGYAAGVYRFADSQNHAKMGGEIGAMAKKALTEHTYAFVGIAAPLEKRPNPIFRVGTGFTF